MSASLRSSASACIRRGANRSVLPAAVAALVALLCVLAAAPAAEPMWRAKAPASSFVPDWSRADQTDARATGRFLERVWPRLRDASESLNARLKAKTGQVYSGPMSPAERAGGVVCFPLKAEQVLPWYAVPTPEQVQQRTFRTFAARGQSEAVCVAVHALKDVKAVAVTCGDLTGPAGAKIPASAVTVRLSLSWTIDPRGRGRSIHARQMVLLKTDGWDIPRGRTYEWVVDAHVPADAKAGVYRGKIAVRASGKTAAEFDLELEVLPFALTDNGCRWGAFMTVNPAYATEAWCDLNARYGLNTLAWWNLDDPKLNWTWDGCRREETVLSKLRYADGTILSAKDVARLPEWLLKRWDGTFLTFRLPEVVGLPREHAARAPFYKKPLKLKPALGEVPPEQAKWICYDRPGMLSNFANESVESVRFLKDDAFAAFDRGMKRLKEYGFAGPITWFGSGGPTVPWEIRLVAQRFGPKYTRAGWKWRRAVTEENTNHTWYLANAAIAKTLDHARRELGWPEVVWCPCDESFQYRGVSGRSVPNMMGEMMPYVRRHAPGFRVYTVVWHKEHNWKGMWQCAVLQRDAKDSAGRDSTIYGPFQVICTNCPNDLDRKLTWDAGGEYWTYTFVISALPEFGRTRFAYGFTGARHYSAVVYGFADTDRTHDLAADEDVLKSHWITGQYTLNYYLGGGEAGEGTIRHALASHQALACRAGATDRKYVETLRKHAHESGSAEDIAFLAALPARIDRIGAAGRGGVDDFTAELTDESAVEKLRREIAMRIKALAGR